VAQKGSRGENRGDHARGSSEVETALFATSRHRSDKTARGSGLSELVDATSKESVRTSGSQIQGKQQDF